MPKLLRDLKRFYTQHKRSHLPWRQTRDPYKILVSEVMLQQTQVERVIPFYERFIKKFPTSHKLAKAKLSEVLALWSGLGYNRRAKYLHDTAKILSAKLPKKGEMNGSPTPFSGVLPGVGPYTRAAVEAFAFNKPTVFVETNIRTVFLHYFFPNKKKVDDADILPLVAQALAQSKMEPRDFYAALMDYGSHLKKQGIKLNKQSRHYTKQSKFEGSRRQARAASLRALLAQGASEEEIERALHA